MPPDSSRTRRVRASSWLLLALSVAGLVLLWVLLNLYTGGMHGWIAPIAALDLAWVLRFGGWRPGIGRALLGLGGTAMVVVAAQWFIIATQLGNQLGLAPWESALKLGLGHAWTLAGLTNGPWELACMVVAAVIALLASR